MKKVASPINQSTLEADACSRTEPRENLCERVVQAHKWFRDCKSSPANGTPDQKLSLRHFKPIT